jgi:hypothetical protein
VLLDNALDSDHMSDENAERQTNKDQGSGDNTSNESTDDEAKGDNMGVSTVILERLENEDQVDKKVRLFEGSS